jgi:peroxiredoxin
MGSERERGVDYDEYMLLRCSTAAVLAIALSQPVAARDYGPAIGAPMPDFRLPDADGQVHTLKSLLGAKGAVLLVYRSADWCPYCKAQLTELDRHQNTFRRLGLGVAAVSYDSGAVLRDFAQRKNIHLTLLSDADSKFIRALGILNETVPKDSPYFGIPYPGVFVLDGKGIIRAKYFADDYRERYTSAGILLHEFGVIPPADDNEIEGKQLTLQAGASNALVSAGQTIALTLEVELKPNMHVYAPGVDGYIPIDWKMKDSDQAVARATVYPGAQKLYLKAIDETVPAFSGHFLLTRDLTIGPEEKVQGALDRSGRFSVEGTLRYQACDDRICYIPQELPIRWTFEYQTLDQQRVPGQLQRKAGGAKE